MRFDSIFENSQVKSRVEFSFIIVTLTIQEILDTTMNVYLGYWCPEKGHTRPKDTATCGESFNPRRKAERARASGKCPHRTFERRGSEAIHLINV